MNVRWTPRALADLDAIYHHIAKDNPTAAAELVDRILRLVEETLTAQPQIGRPGRVAGTREIIASPSYLIAYRVTAELIDILAVRHAAQLWPGSFG